MALWTFKCFLAEQRRNIMGDWYEELPIAARAKFDTMLEQLRDTPNSRWNPKMVCQLTDSDSIYEIRFKIRNVLYRPLGFFGPNRHEFTFLVPAHEQGDRFVPRNAISLAEQRKIIVLHNKESVCECTF